MDGENPFSDLMGDNYESDDEAAALDAHYRDTIGAELEFYGMPENYGREVVVDFSALNPEELVNMRQYYFPTLVDAVRFLGELGVLSFSRIIPDEDNDGFYVSIGESTTQERIVQS